MGGDTLPIPQHPFCKTLLQVIPIKTASRSADDPLIGTHFANRRHDHANKRRVFIRARVCSPEMREVWLIPNLPYHSTVLVMFDRCGGEIGKRSTTFSRSRR